MVINLILITQSSLSVEVFNVYIFYLWLKETYLRTFKEDKIRPQHGHMKHEKVIKATYY